MREYKYIAFNKFTLIYIYMKKIPPIFVNENEYRDKKSVKLLNERLSDLYLDVVWFANARWGNIYIGIEDNEWLPNPTQKIDPLQIQKIKKKIAENTYNVYPIEWEILTTANWWEVLKLTVLPTTNAVACRSDGVYTIRFTDETNRIYPDDLMHLLVEKNNFIRETIKTDFDYQDHDKKLLEHLISSIKNSDVVDDFIKNKTDKEICKYYYLVDKDKLTNLWVLWIWSNIMRAKMVYPLRLSIVFFDKAGNRTRKSKDYTDLSLSPLQVLEKVVYDDIRDQWIEVSNWMFRKFINFFPREVIKELVTNAICHRSYTLNWDVYINIYQDSKIEIVSPGSLPFWVTPENILHKSQPRNQHMAELAKATRMMEKLWSWYDKIYEILSEDWLEKPTVENGTDYVKATLKHQIPNVATVWIMERIKRDYNLSQKDIICLWTIAYFQKCNAVEICKYLQISVNELGDWIWNLIWFKLIHKKGKWRGMLYEIDPWLLKKINHKPRTNLRWIEIHRLKALIQEDLWKYPNSSISEIHERVWLELPIHQIRNAINKLILDGHLQKKWELKRTRYFI